MKQFVSNITSNTLSFFFFFNREVGEDSIHPVVTVKSGVTNSAIDKGKSLLHLC